MFMLRNNKGGSDPSWNRLDRDRQAPHVFRQTTDIIHKNSSSPALKNRKLPVTSSESSLADFRHGSPLPVQGGKRKLNRSRDLSGTVPPEKKPKLGAEDLLKDLRHSMQLAVEAFKFHPSIPSLGWYQHLRMQLAAISAFKGPVDAGLFEDLAMKASYKIPDLSTFDSEPDVRDQIKTDFTKMESLCKDLLAQAPEGPISSRRTGLPFPEIIFLSMPFYQYALLRAYAPSRILWGEDDKDFAKALRAATLLIAHMPDFHLKGNPSEKLIKILHTIIPSGPDYHWCMDERTTSQDEPQFDLVYRRYRDTYPLIIAEVNQDMGEGEPFTRGNYLYSKFVTRPKLKFKRVREECGAPTLFIELAGTNLYFGGAVYDSMNGPQAVQRLPGSVALEKDFGYNLQQAAYSFWALLKSVHWLKREIVVVDQNNKLVSTSSSYHTRKFVIDVPRVGLESGGIDITESIYDGILYKAKLDFSRHGIENENVMQTLKQKGLAKNSPDQLYILKLTYPHRKETHGKSVHKLLAEHSFAPALYHEFAPSLEDVTQGMNLTMSLKSNPLIRYHLMEFLPPPTKCEPGWVTLDDFAEDAGIAALYKVDIKKTLKYIIGILKKKRMVHGDMRPNIMIHVKIQQDNSFRPLYRQDIKLIDLRVVDFDWSGKAGEVQYPAIRNPDIRYWPGEDGQWIMESDDGMMVDEWMKAWPDESQSTEE